ncbi:hypothetical protein ACUWOJ_004181 [Vibrio vulnificus]
MKNLLIFITALFVITGCSTTNFTQIQGAFYETGDSDCKTWRLYSGARSALMCYDSNGKYTGTRPPQNYSEVVAYKAREQQQQQQAMQSLSDAASALNEAVAASQPTYCTANKIGSTTYVNCN